MFLIDYFLYTSIYQYVTVYRKTIKKIIVYACAKIDEKRVKIYEIKKLRGCGIVFFVFGIEDGAKLHCHKKGRLTC